jgi:hypothetical protein
MTVREAADHFRRLDEADPISPPGLPRPPGYERALCRSVLNWVWVALGHQQLYAAAARWYASAFTAEPQLAEAFTAEPQLLAGSPTTNHRYLAAYAAARAGYGQGRDAAGLDEESRAGFRRQALDWLRAQLGSWLRLLEQEPENAWYVARDMKYWLGDPGLAGVRGPEALARLSEAERQAWQELWADVADTLARAEGAAAPEEGAGRKGQLPER